jgi:uncharacterized membrane protein YccC
LLPLAALVAWWPSYRVAPVTAIIVLLVPHGDAGPVQAAIERLIEIALGCTVALGVALAITPSRAHRLLSVAAADALTPMRGQILLLLAGIAEPVHPAAVIALHDRIRGAIERCVVAAADASHERNSYLTTAPDPDPLVRSLRRISHNLIMLARAAETTARAAVRTTCQPRQAIWGRGRRISDRTCRRVEPESAGADAHAVAAGAVGIRGRDRGAPP